MAKQVIQKTTCDYCGVDIPNNFAPIEVSTRATGVSIDIRKGMATTYGFGEGKEFCTRLCAALYFLKCLGYKDGEYTITD